MLVIVSIIILLAGIALPTILQVRRQIAVKASQSLINNLETGCKLYRDDWGEFPPDDDQEMKAWGCPEKWNGAKMLVQCLLGYFDDLGDDGAPDPDARDDGVDGWGFRMQANKRKVGPYVDPDRVRMQLENEGNKKREGLVFIDEFENKVNYTRFEGDGPNDGYYKDNDGDHFRRDFFLWTEGPDGKKTSYRDEATTDDITNFLPE
jgi:type II secretory pathway pseudopilin PulG